MKMHPRLEASFLGALCKVVGRHQGGPTREGRGHLLNSPGRFRMERFLKRQHNLLTHGFAQHYQQHGRYLADGSPS